MFNTDIFKNTKNIASIGLITGLYVIVTILFNPISYGFIQFRISEILVLLSYFNPIYGWAVFLGCLISNLNSPLGTIDIIVGSLSTFLSAYCIYKSSNFFLSSLWGTIWSIPVGIMISYILSLPYLQTIFFVMLSQFIIITLIGYPIFKILIKNKSFYNLLKSKK